jgi:hypothetical protein
MNCRTSRPAPSQRSRPRVQARSRAPTVRASFAGSAIAYQKVVLSLSDRLGKGKPRASSGDPDPCGSNDQDQASAPHRCRVHATRGAKSCATNARMNTASGTPTIPIRKRRLPGGTGRVVAAGISASVPSSINRLCVDGVCRQSSAHPIRTVNTSSSLDGRMKNSNARGFTIGSVALTATSHPNTITPLASAPPTTPSRRCRGVRRAATRKV